MARCDKCALCWTLLALWGIGCDQNIDRFDTTQGDAFCGRIVGGPFVREGFDRQLQLQLHLDMAQLNTVPGDISTDDSDIGACAPKPLFSSARLRAPKKLESDALSAFTFEDSSLMNLLTWVDSNCDGTYLAVVSLMRDEHVEVRLLRGALDERGNEAGPFGVFKLQRAQGSCNFAPGSGSE
jgi:hypothetical protein